MMNNDAEVARPCLASHQRNADRLDGLGYIAEQNRDGPHGRHGVSMANTSF